MANHRISGCTLNVLFYEIEQTLTIVESVDGVEERINVFPVGKGRNVATGRDKEILVILA